MALYCLHEVLFFFFYRNGHFYFSRKQLGQMGKVFFLFEDQLCRNILCVDLMQGAGNIQAEIVNWMWQQI